jgi:hypothetical protein
MDAVFAGKLSRAKNLTRSETGPRAAPAPTYIAEDVLRRTGS